MPPSKAPSAPQDATDTALAPLNAEIAEYLSQIPERHPQVGSGRPSYCTRLTVSRIVLALAQGNTYKNAARLGGVSYEAFQTWMGKGDTDDVTDENRTYVLFRKAVLAAEASCEDAWIRGVEAGGRTDWKAYGWLLGRRHAASWAERSREGESGRSGVVINVGIALSPSAEQPQAIETSWVSVPALPDGDS